MTDDTPDLVTAGHTVEATAPDNLSPVGDAAAPDDLSPDDDTGAENVSGDDVSPDVAALRKEAASHRRKARAAEAERDALAGRVEALQRAEAQRVAGMISEGFRPLSDPSDLWRAEGVELSAMLAEDGTVDPERVREAARGVGIAHPSWVHRPPVDFDGGKGSGSQIDDVPSFGAALKGGRG